MNALVTFTPSQMSLIKNTVAKDTNPIEYNLFMEMAKARGLNPLLRHIFAQVYNKEPKLDKQGKPYPNQKERQLVIVVSREGQRALAERTKTYRPDERAPRFEQDDAKKSMTNPAGLVSAEVSVFKHSHGAWFPVTEVAYWEEAAPVVEIWEGKGDDRHATGMFELQKGKDSWKKMPRLMLAKVAEMAALRKAFPDDFGGLYSQEEIDRTEVLDLSPSEWVEQAEKEDRIQKLGGPDQYIVDWLDGGELQSVPGGKFADQVLAFIATCKDEPGTIRAWRDRNRHSFNQFWGSHKGEALELKTALERAALNPIEKAEGR